MATGSEAVWRSLFWETRGSMAKSRWRQDLGNPWKSPQRAGDGNFTWRPASRLLCLPGPVYTATLITLLLSLTPAVHTGDTVADRVYTLVRMNGEPVPGEVEFRSTSGNRHWLHVEESVLRLKRDRTFAVSARFYGSLLRDGARPPRVASMRLLNDAAHGRYTIRGDTLVLHVEKRKDSAGGTIYGRISGDRVRIRHMLKDGNLRHNVDIELRIDPGIW